jgi:hypothetical protein
MVGYISFSGNLVNKNSLQERKTLATILAREKIEDLRSIGIQTTLTAANSTDGGTTVWGDAMDRQGNRIGNEGTSGAIYTRTWLINDTNAPLLIATVTVSWDYMSGTRSISLSTQFQQS